MKAKEMEWTEYRDENIVKNKIMSPLIQVHDQQRQGVDFFSIELIKLCFIIEFDNDALNIAIFVLFLL